MKSNKELWDIILENDNLINDCIWKKRDTWKGIMSFEEVKSEYLVILHYELNKIYNIKKLEIKPTTAIYNNIVIYNRIDRIKNKEWKHKNYLDIDDFKEKI